MRCRAFLFPRAAPSTRRHEPPTTSSSPTKRSSTPDDLTETFIRSSGPGRPERQQGRDRRAAALRCGQCAGPVGARPRARDQACRPESATKDGVIVFEAGRFRTQEQNRADARARLTALIAKAAEPPPKPRKKTQAVERRGRTAAEDKGRALDGQEAARPRRRRLIRPLCRTMRMAAFRVAVAADGWQLGSSNESDRVGPCQSCRAASATSRPISTAPRKKRWSRTSAASSRRRRSTCRPCRRPASR